MKDSLPLIESAQTNFKSVAIVTKGLEVGTYQQPWGKAIPAVASQNITLKVWGGGLATATVNLRDITSTTLAGQKVGTVTAPESATNHAVSVSAQLQTTPDQPSIGWRLTHPLR
jgi:hypothetical protein